MAILGKVAGSMLKDNLVRNGVDLTLDTNLVYFDVNNRRIGINTVLPGNALTVNSNATVGCVYINNNVMTSVNGNLVLSAVYGNIDVYNLRIGNVATPVYDTDVTNKAYVDYVANSATPNLTISDGTRTDNVGLTFQTLTFFGNTNQSNVYVTNNQVSFSFVSDPTIYGSLTVVSNVSANYGSYSGNVTAANANITGNIIASNLTVNSNVIAANILISNNSITSSVGNLVLHSINGDISASSNRISDVLDPVYTQDVATKAYVDSSLSSQVILGNTVQMGSNTTGALVSNAVTLTTTTYITDGIAQLNSVLGKLVPPSPGNFPNSTALSLSGLSTLGRMTNFTQTDNSGWGNLSVAAGTSVTTGIRAATLTTNTFTRQGPGDSGNVQVIVNGAATGYRVMLSGSVNNGTYGHLIISSNQDYSVLSGGSGGFWSSFSAQGSGANALPGWNRIYLTHSAGSSTNTSTWYYDNNNPGTPIFSNVSLTLVTNSSTFSSTIPHLNSSSSWRVVGNVNRLSGDTYYTSDTFLTGSAGGSFAAPSSVTYTQAGVTTPLVRNAYVTSGSAYFTTTAATATGFGSSSTGPSMTAFNSYTSNSYTWSPGVTVLYKTGTSNQIEESSLTVNGTIGSGSGSVYRIVGIGSTDTPAYTGSEATFDSTNGPLQSYDATVVAAVLKHDRTNYSTGYQPVGPDLTSRSSSAAQYFTFKFVRTSVSKFNIKVTGNIAGLYVALPGSTIDTTSTLNGWLNANVAYAGSGVPGAGVGGNGSDGCAIGGPILTNTAITNSNVTVTFGTVSSSSTATNEIYVRVKLVNGQTVSLLQVGGATN